jgi:AraC-like DNA-binding protein
MSQSAPPDAMPIKVVKSLLRVIVAQGADVDAVLASCGLTFNPMLEIPGQPQYVSALVYSKLYRQVMAILQDESFGLSSLTKAPPGTFRMMCLFIIHCKNLRQAMLRSAAFFDYVDHVAQSFLRPRHPVTMADEGRTAVCRFNNPNSGSGGTHNSPGSKNDRNQLRSDASVNYMMHRFYCWLIGQDIPIIKVNFPHDAPGDPEKYEMLYNAPVNFNTGENAVYIPAEYLDAPIAQDEASLRDFLRTAPYQLVSRQEPQTTHKLADHVRAMIEAEMQGEFPSIETIASKMAISSRTLHRRLTREGTSFQEIKDDIRRDAAIAYMNRDELTINAVSILMGFQDTSAFYRAFKKWTGVSPGEYRSRELQQKRGARA